MAVSRIDTTMETDEGQRVLPFLLQFDKPIASQMKLAEWNPEKDLLAMVTEDNKILLHRFNWQRLWTLSPGKSITSLCWRPDGKAIAVGHEDGMILLHDVENGKLLRSIKYHDVAVVCLNWVDDRQHNEEDSGNASIYEDRTSRFFPPPPRVPKMPGLVPGDTGLMDEDEYLPCELSNSSHQHFSILCSGDRAGNICFSIFGIFLIGKINIHDFPLSNVQAGIHIVDRLANASIHKVALANDLCHLIVLCSGELFEGTESCHEQISTDYMCGFHCLVLDTSIFSKRKNELHQVAQQASNIEDLTEVIRTSLSVMLRHWSDAMNAFHEKFNSLPFLITDHGLESNPQEEFLSLLGGARTSPPVHQFLVNSLGEAGLKKVSKVVCNAGKELQLVVLDHLQPAAEIIGFRMGELRGLSKWRARYESIGLDEALIDNATEEAGMFLVQIERFMRILSSVVQQFSNFFNWLQKAVKLLMSEPSDQLLPFNSELVILFLKFLYDQDPIRQLVELSETNQNVEVDLKMIERVRELTLFGGFSDSNFLKRSLAKEFQQLEYSFKEALQMPFTAISRKILCEDFLPLFPVALSIRSVPTIVPTSLSFYKEPFGEMLGDQTCHECIVDYMSFKIPEESLPGISNCIGIAKAFMRVSGNVEKKATLLCIPDGYHCVDLSLYKDGQIVILLNETTTTSEGSGNAFMVVLHAKDLPFVPVSGVDSLNYWHLDAVKGSVVYMRLENEKVRNIPYSVIVPLAVSASRGVACVFSARKRALVYILDEDEDEDEASDAE